MSLRLILTCEHGGNDVPDAYAHVFRGRRALRALAGHRGLDVGALALAQFLARALGAPLHTAQVTRLLVDLNRSPGHPGLFSEFSRKVDAAQREKLLATFYAPHRRRVTESIEASIRGGAVLHVAVHSYAPRLRGLERNADIGLLYDPARRKERELCIRWQQALGSIDARLRVRRNFPYRGSADGLATHLRRVFAPANYLGIELEVNQRRLREAPDATARALAAALGGLGIGGPPATTR